MGTLGDSPYERNNKMVTWNISHMLIAHVQNKVSNSSIFFFFTPEIEA